MTPEEAERLQDELVRGHFDKMKAIAEKSLVNTEKWAGVTARMADYHANSDTKVSEILGGQLAELLTTTPEKGPVA